MIGVVGWDALLEMLFKLENHGQTCDFDDGGDDEDEKKNDPDIHEYGLHAVLYTKLVEIWDVDCMIAWA